MNVFFIGDPIRLVMRPDLKVFEGVMTGWDDVAIYLDGLGFPRDDIVEMEPI